jgi:IS30 family transposase
MLRMLDRHAVLALVRAQVTAREIAEQLKVSVRTVRRIVREGEVATGDDAAARSARQVGRPQVTEAVRARVHALVLEAPERPPGEICRLLKEDGTPLGLSTGVSRAHGGARDDPDPAASALRRCGRRIRAV